MFPSRLNLAFLFIRLPEQLLTLIVKVLLDNDKALLVNRTLSCMVLKEALPAVTIDIPATYNYLHDYQIPSIVPVVTNQVIMWGHFLLEIHHYLYANILVGECLSNNIASFNDVLVTSFDFFVCIFSCVRGSKAAANLFHN